MDKGGKAPEETMVRGIYTGASGMTAMVNVMDNVANNLANINTDGFKKETSVLKAFPEMLIRRVNDDGVVKFPLGSYDLAPVVGKLGTGVEYNESWVRYEQGSLQDTGNDFDLALESEGFFTVRTEQGERYTRAGGFTVSNEGYLVDKHGNQVLGENGPVKVGQNNFQVDKQGNIFVNADFAPTDFVDKAGNDWKGQTKLDRLKIVDFPERRYLEKEGNTYYREGEFSGAAFVAEGNARAYVRQGFLEKSNVDGVVEMTKMIEVQRLYEANQKVIQTSDELLGRAVNQVGRGLA